ncbi:beta-galactosidase [Paenibacillus doosanensis]|uniref:beta-galactosidase n=1 Tax=Paenibacillus doosanensis TaxID=1229154 RepID=UPI00217F3331|nr:beta-galactosidase [Paenibacillus doosanensis]MCS7459773.1 beta-galactosidase [Paenibacillus doosanensis]
MSFAPVAFSKIVYGGDYNPEQFPRDIWDEDMRLFKLAGIDIATLNVFSWSLNQPDETTYRFDWLDEAMNKLQEHGVKVCLGTSTAAHPAWMARKYPDVLTVTADGKQRKYGRRHNSCPNSPTFRHYAGLMARKLAERYKDHPALLLWHVNNEIGIRCYCERCEQAFRKWLQRRYGTLEKLNQAWYSRFWGHTFYDWEEIVLPSGLSEGLSGGNADQTAFQGITLDFFRFNCDSWLECYLIEYDAIKEVMPNAIVTTNFQGNGTYKPLDYFKWAPYLDIAALDIYPENHTPESYMAMRYDLMRGIKDGAPFMLMEQSPGVINWKSVNPVKRPGVMRVRSYQAIARGAESIMFFQLRRSLGAYEKFHGAVIDHAGHEHTRVFRECAQLGGELQRLGGQLIGSTIKSRVGILFDWENWWAVELGGGPSSYIKYLDQVQKYYDALYSNHVQVDIIHVKTDLSGYDLVIAPLLYMVKQGFAGKLERYVEQGGTLVTTFFSGIVNETDLVTPGGYPGELRKLLGIWVEEIDALFPEQRNSLVMQEPLGSLEGAYACRTACETVHTEGAEAVAVFGGDYYAGCPAITRHSYGRGEAWYAAAEPDGAFLRKWMGYLCERAGIAPLCEAPEDVEVTCREKDGIRYTFIMNHADEEREIDAGDTVRTELLSGTEVCGLLRLEPKGVLILRQAGEDEA